MGYVEVTTDLERDYGNMLGVISKSKGHTRELPMRIEAPQLDRVWFATLSSSANVKEIVTKLPGILAASTPAAMPELGIVRLDSRPAGNDSGVILLYPDGISGSIDVTWAEALEALNGILGSPRLESKYKKLRKAPGAEKHIFLGTTPTTPWPLHFALSLDVDTLPYSPPGLPGDITNLWVMGAQMPERCLAWSAEHGWLDVMKHWRTP
jgi:hypothetical protein